MRTDYRGPLRDEPLALELHNTLYAVGGAEHDGLTEPGQARAWLDALTERMAPADPPGGRPPTITELVALRDAIRAGLHAMLADEEPAPGTLEAINRASRRAPRSPRLDETPAGLVAATDHHGATRADVVVAELARDAIDLLTGPRRDDLRSCGAPGCVLVFLKDHPRREWCSNACGNRARQARHYRRTRD